MYKVEFILKSREDVKYFDFSSAERGNIKVNAPSDFIIPSLKGESIKVAFPAEVRCHFGSHESVGQLFLGKEFASKSIGTEPKKDYLQGNQPVIFKITNGGNVTGYQFEGIKVKEGDYLGVLRFVSRQFHNLSVSGSTAGVDSKDVKVIVMDRNGKIFNPVDNTWK